MKTLPTFQCYSCGNCELKLNDNLEENPTIGFCYKFFENVKLEEKNIRCWTSKPHTYFEGLVELKENQTKTDFFKMHKRANHLKIELKESNQLNLFS